MTTIEDINSQHLLGINEGEADIEDDSGDDDELFEEFSRMDHDDKMYVVLDELFRCLHQ